MKQLIRYFAIGFALAALSATTTLARAEIGSPDTAAAGKEAIAAEVAAAGVTVQPNFFQGDFVEFYPMLLNNVGGFDSVLVVSNLLDSFGSVDICVVPQGTSQFQCTSGISLGPRQTLFFYAGSGALTFLRNATGQVWVFAGPNTFGASMAFILDQGGAGLTSVMPLEF
jgi:hypothetical protein